MDTDAIIADIGRRQHGIVTRTQLRAAGIGRGSINTRIARSSLLRVYHGVYAIGHAPTTQDARYMAAVLAVGAGAAVSHHAAADLHRLTRAAPPRLDITSSGCFRGTIGGTAHRSRSFVVEEVTRVRGIPTTSVARTLVDLADVLTLGQLVNVIHEAEFRGRLNLRALSRSMARNHTRRGHALLVAALADHASGSAGTKSILEDRFISLIASADIPRPSVNVRLDVADGWIEVDCHWPDSRLCVEVDGVGHRRARTRREDAERDAALTRAGYTVVRYSAAQLRRTPRAVMSDVREHLAAAGQRHRA